MDSLPEDIQHLIYKYKHQLEFFIVLDELNTGVFYYCGWCGKGHRLSRQCQCEGGTFSEDGYYDSDGYGDSDSDYDRYDPDGPLWMYSM